MGILTALSTAVTGLSAQSCALENISGNIANSQTVGFERVDTSFVDLIPDGPARQESSGSLGACSSLSTEQLVAGERTIGVDVQGATRTLDSLVQRQLRLERAGAAYTSVKATAHSALDSLFDTVGGTGSLPTQLSGIADKLQTLAANPSSYVAQSEVLSAASDLAGTLNGLSGQVQVLRQNAEGALAADVGKASGFLGQIATLSGKLVAGPSAALSDQRDALVDQLSTLLDVKATTQPNGSLSLSTTGGLTLVDGTAATRLSFDAHTLWPQATYSTDPSRRTVGTITATDASGATRDVLASGLILSGDIAAQLELRDTVLPQTQAQLDALAGGLASALADKTVAGSTATAGNASGFDLDLSGLRAGNGMTVSVIDAGGAKRTLTFVTATSAAGVAAASAAGQTAIDFSGGLASVATQIGTALGSGYAVSNPSGSTLRVLNDGSTTSVGALSAQVTVTGLATGDPELPLFVDAGRNGAAFTGSFEGGSQLSGFAARVAVNPAVVANRSSLAVYGPSVASGDSTRPQLLADRLASTPRTFSGAAGIGGSNAPWTGSVSDFAEQIVATQAADAQAATSLDSGQTVVLNSVESRFSDGAAVNIDTELTNLIQLHTAYGANARVLTAAKDLFDTLFRIAG